MAINEKHSTDLLTSAYWHYAKLALEAKQKAYSPYSKFSVGCVVIDENDYVHKGCNVENISYSATVCAERVALTKMVSEGGHSGQVIFLITDSEEPSFPCGMCLQVMGELAPDSVFFSISNDLKFFKTGYLKELYPHSFTAKLGGNP